MDFSLPLVTNLNFIEVTQKQEDMPSPLSDQILNFCESELFPDIQNSEVASSSNGCCYDEQSSYGTNFDLNKFGEKSDEAIATSAKAATSTTDVSPSRGANIENNNDNNNSSINNDNLSMIFDAQEDIDNDISASIDFTVPNFLNQQEEQFVNDMHQGSVTDAVAGNLYHPDHSLVVPLMGPSYGQVYEEESLTSVPHYMRLATSSPILDPAMATFLQGNINSSEASAIFAAAAGSTLLFGSQIPHQEFDFQGENGRIFCPDALPRIFNCSSDLQALSNESQHLVSGANPLATEMTNFEDTSFKIRKCTPEERREKIHRYLKKRNERNFSKKIKYACRKTLADSRPRVRGRFARNDEFGEAISKANSCGTHVEEDNSTSDHHQDVKLNNIIFHDSNMVNDHQKFSVNHQNGGIFASNCLTSSGPYDICAPLYCTDGQMH